MKLSKAQQSVIEKAKKEIDLARENNFYDWQRKRYGFVIWNCKPVREMTDEEIDKMLLEQKQQGYNIKEERYQKLLNGVTDTCHASGSTLKKLEALGMIEIIKDSTGEHYYGFDEIKIIGY